MLRATNALAALLAALALAACGGGGEDDGSGDGPERAETPSAQVCPPDAEQALEKAAQDFRADEFDAAFATLKPYEACPRVVRRLEQYRPVAARALLQKARERLAAALRDPRPGNSPQPAVALARVSLRYHPTDEARGFLQRAEAEVAKFHRRFPKAGQTDGGPPPGAGEGGPPEDRGPE